MVTRLYDVLGGQGDRYGGLPMSDWIRGAHESVENGDDGRAAFLLLSLGDLVEDLQSVQNVDAVLFQHYRRRLETAGEDAYRRVRCEIGSAAAFARKGVRYQTAAQSGKSAPDFSVRCPEGRCDVECVVCVTSQTDAPGLLPEIQAAVAKKAKKKYAGPDTVVFVEVVLDAQAYPEPESADYNLYLRREVTRSVEDARIGAVVVFKYVRSATTDGEEVYHRAYLRCDGADIGDEAAWFLDSYFPFSDQ